MNQTNNVAGMSSGVGGPVGGIPMMNNGSAPRSEPNSAQQDTTVLQLNTYIYDYFIKRGYHDCARALVRDESIPVNTTPASKRREGDVNGVDGDAMATDSKDDVKSKIPDDLPRPNLNGDQQQGSFLFDWFNVFWDMFWAQRKRGKSQDAMQYMAHTQNMMRMRDPGQMMRQQGMPNQFNMRNIRGMNPASLQRAALQNNAQNMTPQQMAQLQKNQQMMQHQMQREHSDIEMSGHRPQSPSSVENAPSPSKRPRLDGAQMNGQPMAPNGRGQGQMPGQLNQQQQAQHLLMQHGINPNRMSQAQFQSFQQQNSNAQQKSLQMYSQNLAMQHSRNQAMPNGMMNGAVMPNQAEMMGPMHDGQGMLPMTDFYPNGQMPMRNGMQTPGGQNGNHALQDYQMQLMLLEQQNKRRLLLARQEQDSMARGDGQPGMPGQPNLQSGTSPQGSRTGGSPNPNDQMKRGTPKMPQTGLPGSPNVGDPMAQGRGSPAGMNFNGGQIPPEMAGGGAFYNMKNVPDGVAPNGMRPPSSNPAFTGPQMAQPMDAMARPQVPGAAGRMPSGNWQQGPQGQPMVPPQQPQPPQQQPAGQPQPAGTPQERNAMPPPQAPPGGGNAGHTQTSSPQPGAAPPTPQQSNKPAPKAKNAKENNRKRPPKKTATTNAANTAATPSSEAEPAPTPTPSTPITPVHPNSFNNKGAGNATTNAPQPTSAPAPQNMVQQQPEPNAHFNMDLPEPNFPSIDFNEIANQDLLENFDFDSFLNTDDTFGFGDPSMSYPPPDGVEAGTGENV